MPLIDKFFLIRSTLVLASKARGFTSPNPMVGAIILDQEGNLLSEGYHQKAGTDHAEIVALKKAGTKAKDGILFVNLEPCSHYGKTPPCSQAIIEAGIKKVFIGTLDPNIKVNGQGVSQLREAGIEVEYGILEDECLQLNRFFFHWIEAGTPWVTLKIAATLNGKIFSENTNKITGEEVKSRVHEMRAEHDVILTGSGTVLLDNPLMTVRLANSAKKTIRVVLDRRLRCLPSHNIFHQDGKTFLFTSLNNIEKANQLKFPNTEIIPYPDSLDELLIYLGKRNILSVMVEAGSEINSFFLNSSIPNLDGLLKPRFNELFYFLSPKIFPESALSFSSIQEISNLKLQSVKQYGEDLLLQMLP